MGLTIFVVFFTFICIPGLHALTLVPSENPVAIGRNVTISVNEPIYIKTGLWLYGASTLFLWYPGDFIQGNSHREGILFDNSTLNLTLLSVTRSNSGVYALESLKPNKFIINITLDVQEPISNVIASANKTDLVEFNDTATFTCTANGAPEYFSWYNGSSLLTAGGRIQLSSSGQNLAISNIMRYDIGPFTCLVVNNVSSDKSIPINITVNYGPSDLKITTFPEQTVYISGSNITLSCSADSKPAASFYWLWNNNILNANSQNYSLINAAQNQTGQFTCVAQNPVTLRYVAVTTTINIVDPISNIQVNPISYPILHKSFSLSCHVVGPVNSIQWRKSEVLQANNNISFSSDNSTLTFNQLTFSDEGEYKCTASNDVSTMTSHSYNLLINYGPFNTIASGPSVAAVGTTVTFSCSSDSRPESQYSWIFSGSKVGDGAVYATAVNNSGQYTCIAFNNITGEMYNSSVTLTAFVPVSNAMVMFNQQPIFNQTFALNCNASGDVHHVQWMKNNASVQNGSSILNFSTLSLEDEGLYHCQASNAISSVTSEAISLKVFYGPWNVHVSGPSIGAVGSSVTFSCSADSYPNIQYSWWFNHLQVGNSQEYVSGALTSNSSGLYTCQAFNHITAVRSNASLEFTSINPVSSVTVNMGIQHPVFGQPFSLTCSASGDNTHIQWMKNQIILYPGNGITFSSDNSILIFQNLTLTNGGSYQCTASNDVSNMTSEPYDLIVNYGPWNTTVTGPSLAETESNVTFKCSADSHPESQYSWWFNSSHVANGLVYTTGALSVNNSGLYTCQAFNTITGLSSSASQFLTVIDQITTVEVIPDQLIPLASKPLQLKCNVYGPYLQLHWLKEDQILQSSDKIAISGDNTTLAFHSLQTADNGKYYCVAINALKMQRSNPYDLVVIFGPQSVQIIVSPGYPPNLTCQAVSQPPAVYQWILENNTIVGNQATITIPVHSILGSNYTCVARNPLTNVTIFTSQVINKPNAAVSFQANLVLMALVSLLLLVLE